MSLSVTKPFQLEIGPLEDVLPVGSLVYVTCYGSYCGLKGIVRAIDVIDAPLCFYLVALLDGQTSEPLWFVHDDVAAVEGENSYKTLSHSVDGPSIQPDAGGKTFAEPTGGPYKRSHERCPEAQDNGKMKRSQWSDTKMTIPTKVPLKTYQQLRGQYQEQNEVDKQLIQKQRKIIQTRLEQMQNHKKLIEYNKEYIENQKQFIQRNQERIELLKRTISVLVWSQRNRASI